MKNIYILCVLFFLLGGCIKEDKACTPVPPASEEAQIMSFANAQGMNVIKHSSGIYYQVIATGYGPRPTITSEITVGYVGKLLDGTIFDQNASIKNQLAKFIEGWQIGVPLIQKHGKIKLIIPSAYAYGCTSYGNIPANSILYFEIHLLDVQ